MMDDLMLAPLRDAQKRLVADTVALDAFFAFQLVEPGGEEHRGVRVGGIKLLQQRLVIEAQPAGIVGDEPELDKEQTGVAADPAHAAGPGKVRLDGSDACHADNIAYIALFVKK